MKKTKIQSKLLQTIDSTTVVAGETTTVTIE